jgi:hypothetical protein
LRPCELGWMGEWGLMQRRGGCQAAAPKRIRGAVQAVRYTGLCFLAVKTPRSIRGACTVTPRPHRTPCTRVWRCTIKFRRGVARFCSLGANWAMTSAPYTVKLDAESARELAQRGGTILLLDVPENTAVGVDQQVRRAGGTPPRSLDAQKAPMHAAADHCLRRPPLPPPPPAASSLYSRWPPPPFLCCRPSWLARASRA